MRQLERSGSENDDVIRIVGSVPKRQMDQSYWCYKCSVWSAVQWPTESAEIHWLEERKEMLCSVWSVKWTAALKFATRLIAATVVTCDEVLFFHDQRWTHRLWNAWGICLWISLFIDFPEKSAFCFDFETKIKKQNKIYRFSPRKRRTKSLNDTGFYPLC